MMSLTDCHGNHAHRSTAWYHQQQEASKIWLGENQWPYHGYLVNPHPTFRILFSAKTNIYWLVQEGFLAIQIAVYTLTCI